MHEPAWFRVARVIVLTLLGLFAILPVYVMLTASVKPLPMSRARSAGSPAT